MNKESIDLILEKCPDIKKDGREKLESMKRGRFCMHRSWGLGQIMDYNDVTNRLIIDFYDGKSGHAMDPVFCIKNLTILPDNHVLVRSKKDPQTIESIIKDSPADLVVDYLSGCKNNSAHENEIEMIFKYLLLNKHTKKTWASIKKQIATDHRIASPKKKTDSYVLRSQPVSKEQEILEEFYLSRQPIKKILLAEKLYSFCKNVEDVKTETPQILDELAKIVQDNKRLSPSVHFHGCLLRNNFAELANVSIDTLEPNIKTIILETEDLYQLIEELPKNYYKDFFKLITLVYPNEKDWQFSCFNLLKISSGKFVNECIEFLIENNCLDNVIQTLEKWIMEKTAKAPVLLWIIRNRHVRAYKEWVSHLINPQLLSTIFQAIDQEALDISGMRRIPLADYLSEHKDLIEEILAKTTFEEAKDLARTLLLNQGFELLSKRSLLARFIKFFPEIQKLITGSADEQSDYLIVSKESFEARKKELEILSSQKIPENKKAIESARELGDLRENSEYKMARQDQDTLLARKSQLETELSRAQITDFSEISNDVVSIGSVVELTDNTSQKTQTYTILGAWDGNPDNRILSYRSPLGQNLLGKKLNAIAKLRTGNSEKDWIISKITRFCDQSK